MTVKWRGEEVLREIDQAFNDAIEEAAFLIQDTGNEMILDPNKHGAIYTNFFYTSGSGSGRKIIPYGTRPPHQASAPGEAPANDTGKLVASSEVILYRNDFSAVVAWRAPYAAGLQFGTDKILPRPWATLALSAVVPHLPEIVGRKISARLK